MTNSPDLGTYSVTDASSQLPQLAEIVSAVESEPTTIVLTDELGPAAVLVHPEQAPLDAEMVQRWEDADHSVGAAARSAAMDGHEATDLPELWARRLVAHMEVFGARRWQAPIRHLLIQEAQTLVDGALHRVVPQVTRHSEVWQDDAWQVVHTSTEPTNAGSSWMYGFDEPVDPADPAGFTARTMPEAGTRCRLRLTPSERTGRSDLTLAVREFTIESF